METQFLIQNLPDVLDPNLDLLNGLLSKQVLTDRQYFLICSKTNIYEKNDELVGYLSKYTGDFDKVLKIIEDNGQQHVANFIRSSGGLFETFCAVL